jgi:ABC-2 type transport system ATP-binding protein
VLRRLTDVGVRSLTSQPPTLEELFLRHYETDLAGETSAHAAAGQR